MQFDQFACKDTRAYNIDVADEFVEKVRGKKDAAARARRLAYGLTRRQDFDRLIEFAAALEAEAEALARQATVNAVHPAVPLVMQVQQQKQQQVTREIDDDRDDPHP